MSCLPLVNFGRAIFKFFIIVLVYKFSASIRLMLVQMEISVNANEKKYFDNPNLKYLSAKK